MDEKWNIWKPISIPNGKYELMSLQLDGDGLKLIFDDENIKVVVCYKETYLSFRCCDEGDRWKTVDNVLSKEGGSFFKDKLFFKIENSEYKKWFMDETFGIWSEDDFEHHAYVTANDIVDVLAGREPEISVISIK